MSNDSAMNGNSTGQFDFVHRPDNFGYGKRLKKMSIVARFHGKLDAVTMQGMEIGFCGIVSRVV